MARPGMAEQVERSKGTLPMRMADKVAVITGGASGIGLATARLFLTEGAQVAAVDQDVAALAALPAGILGLHADVGDPAAVADAHGRIAAALGPVTTLMTSAGISTGQAVQDTAPEDWDRVMRVNLTGTYLWMRAVLPGMRRGGAIVTVASQLAISGGRGNAAYIASKGAVISLTRSVAVDVAARGIRVNCLAPGAIDTPLLTRGFARHTDPAAARTASEARHAMGRIGAVQEVAEAALYLASDAAGFTTGVVLPVDGGWTAA